VHRTLARAVRSYKDRLSAPLRIVKSFIRPTSMDLRTAAHLWINFNGKNDPMTPKNPAAVELGRKGGKATARKLTPEQRSESARRASQARWAKSKKKTNPRL
jgi:hypothetical protein